MPLPMAEEGARLGLDRPVMPIDPLIEPLGQRFQVTIAEELGGPEGSGEEPGRVHRAEGVDSDRIAGPGVDEVGQHPMVLVGPPEGSFQRQADPGHGLGPTEQAMGRGRSQGQGD